MSGDEIAHASVVSPIDSPASERDPGGTGLVVSREDAVVRSARFGLRFTGGSRSGRAG